MIRALLVEDTRVVGLKQVLRLVNRGEAAQVFAARDADEAFMSEIATACEKADVDVCWVDTKAELGKACGIAVGASAAAVKSLEHKPLPPEGCRG